MKTESLGPTGTQLLGRGASVIGPVRARLFAAEGTMLPQRFKNSLPTHPQCSPGSCTAWGQGRENVPWRATPLGNQALHGN